MRSKDEQHLVRIVNDLIDRFVSPGALICSRKLKDSESFSSELQEVGCEDYWPAIVDSVRGMNDRTLGMIAGLRLLPEDYKDAALLQTPPSEKPIKINRNLTLDGHMRLVDLALPVVVAVMYEIFATEQVIRQKNSLRWLDTWDRSPTVRFPYWPKRAMWDCVAKIAKHRI